MQEENAAAKKSVPAAEPKIHIMFPSSEENTQEDPTEGHGEAGEEQKEEDDDEEPSTVSRYEYVGQGNVQAVRAARRMAGLNDAFPRSDPLLKEYSDFLRMSGAAEKDNANKVTMCLSDIIFHIPLVSFTECYV